jgi:hypothetical protein
VGALFALLRYLAWLQRGVKQCSDAYARLMASAGLPFSPPADATLCLSACVCVWGVVFGRRRLEGREGEG